MVRNLYLRTKLLNLYEIRKQTKVFPYESVGKFLFRLRKFLKRVDVFIKMSARFSRNPYEFSYLCFPKLNIVIH